MALRLSHRLQHASRGTTRSSQAGSRRVRLHGGLPRRARSAAILLRAEEEPKGVQPPGRSGHVRKALEQPVPRELSQQGPSGVPHRLPGVLPGHVGLLQQHRNLVVQGLLPCAGLFAGEACQRACGMEFPSAWRSNICTGTMFQEGRRSISLPLFLPGQTTCGICSKTIAVMDGAVGVPPFVANELDPLRPFSDAVFHQECLDAHPSGALISRLTGAYKTHLKERVCWACRRRITDPDQWFGTGYLSSDPQDLAERFNFCQLHADCIRHWPQRPLLRTALERLSESGKWNPGELAPALEMLSK